MSFMSFISQIETKKKQEENRKSFETEKKKNMKESEEKLKKNANESEDKINNILKEFNEYKRKVQDNEKQLQVMQRINIEK